MGQEKGDSKNVLPMLDAPILGFDKSFEVVRVISSHWLRPPRTIIVRFRSIVRSNERQCSTDNHGTGHAGRDVRKYAPAGACQNAAQLQSSVDFTGT
jgi:hypothetical protein